MKRILFVCAGNTCRSPMAEYLLKDKIEKRNLKEKLDAKSVGMFVSENSKSPSALAVKVLMDEYQIDMSMHHPQMINIDFIMESDLILCMEESMAVYLKANLHNVDEDSIMLVDSLKSYLGKNGDVSDPYGGDEDTYKNSASEINELIELLIQKEVSL
ncbi:MAG: low molecular weight protein arginine phosphatase [Clostridia bacterium]|nr:low molecular weight protein arginine phosphatase [Clostridia bacterium]